MEGGKMKEKEHSHKSSFMLPYCRYPEKHDKKSSFSRNYETHTTLSPLKSTYKNPLTEVKMWLSPRLELDMWFLQDNDHVMLKLCATRNFHIIQCLKRGHRCLARKMNNDWFTRLMFGIRHSESIIEVIIWRLSKNVNKDMEYSAVNLSCSISQMYSFTYSFQYWQKCIYNYHITIIILGKMNPLLSSSLFFHVILLIFYSCTTNCPLMKYV